MLSSLRDVIKKTDIMDNPELLPHQALKAVRQRRFSGESKPPSPEVSSDVASVSSPKQEAPSTYIPVSPLHLSPRMPSSPVSITAPLKMLPTSPTDFQPLQDMIASMDTWQASESLPIVSESLLVDSNSTGTPVMDMQTSQSVTSTLAILPRMTSQSLSSTNTDMEVQAATSLSLLDYKTTQTLATELEMSDSLLDTLTTQIDMQNCQLPELGHILTDNLYTSAPSSFESVFTSAQSTMLGNDHDHLSSISVWSQSDAHIACVSSASKIAQGKHL